MKKPELTSTETKNQYELKIRAFADDLDAKITETENKMKDLVDSAKGEYRSKLENLKKKKQQLTDHLDEVRKTREEEWQRIKSKFQARAESLSNEITEAYEGITSGMDYLFKKLRDR